MRRTWHYVPRRLVKGILALTLAAHGVLMAAADSRDVEVHGVAIAGTKRIPLEAAYVVLVYVNKGKAIKGGCPECWCVRTRGSFTDKNGRFSFPKESPHDHRLKYIAAIMPNHYSASHYFDDSSISNANSELTLALLPRNPGDRNNFSLRFHVDSDLSLLHSHRLDCWRARTREDTDAAMPFLEILRKDVPLQAKDIGRAIHLMKSLPSRESKGR